MQKRRKTPVQLKTIEPQMCNTDLRLRILHGVSFFSALSHAQIEQINSQFHEKGITAGEYLYFAGDPAESLFIIAQGRVKLLRHTAAGKEIMLDLLIPGEFLGTLSPEADSTYPDSARAITAGCVLQISREQFRSILMQHPTVGMQILDIVAARLTAAHETIEQLSSQSAEVRIAATLVRLAAKLGEPHEVGLLIQTPLTRDELAEMTATTPETTSRVISHFQKDGWLTTGRQWIAIKDLKALQSIARLRD